MKLTEVIRQADDLRMNTLGEDQKAQWLHELDGKIAEIMERDIPQNTWPDDRELLMPAPCDNIYVLYLVAMIDYYNQETAMYTNDMAMFNQAYSEAKAWWRRNNIPKSRGNWRAT